MTAARVFIRFSAFISLLITATGSYGMTLRAAPDAAVQATCPFCFVSAPITVQVLNDAARPQAGVSVTFSAPATDAVVPGAGPGPYVVHTDRDGYAIAPAPGFASISGSSFVIEARVAGAPSQAFAVAVQGKAPARMIVSTDEPIAIVESLYDVHALQFWAVALDEDNNNVPNAVVEFSVSDGNGHPSGTFGPNVHRVFVREADSGFAFPPDFTANHLPGRGTMRAATLNPALQPAYMNFYNSARGAVFIDDVALAPRAVRITTAFSEPIAVIVRDRAGHPQRDVAVHFSTQPNFEAGFLGPDGTVFPDLSAITDANGRAEARLPCVPMFPAGTSASIIVTTANGPGTQPGGAAGVIPFDVLPGPSAGIELVSGGNQRTQVNTPFAERWVFRVLDADGLPVPYAVAPMFLDNPPGQPGATFGSPAFLTSYSVADANGIVISPRVTANATPGSAMGVAFAWGGGDGVEIDFENLAAP